MQMQNHHAKIGFSSFYRLRFPRKVERLYQRLKTHQRHDVLMVSLMLMLVSPGASAAFVEVFKEGFDTDTSTTGQTLETYPEYSFSDSDIYSSSTIVSGGSLRFNHDPDATLGQAMTITGFPGEIELSVDIGLSTSVPGYNNVGVRIGENFILFHPGFSGGAFRVIGPGSNNTTNTNMGFTPALDVLHHMKIHVHLDGVFDIKITDGINSSNVFEATFTNIASIGGSISLERNGYTGQSQGQYDNLFVKKSADYSCVGFEPPIEGKVKVRKKRALPLKAELLDHNGFPVSDAGIAEAPALQVDYLAVEEEDSTLVDVTESALAVGLAKDGNEFVFSDDDKWQFNFKTSNYTASGTYRITMVPGNGYIIYPTCEAFFVIE